MTRFCTCTRGLASTLELSRKRKQVAKASCNACGRPLVDGVGPLPASMLSTVGLEDTNFINPDLTWKTVTKGYRSAPRRPRRRASRSLNVGVQLDDKSPKRVEDLLVSESEKLGVAVLGQRFADKGEHVPIKKRRLLLRSPSPPRWTPSPYHEESLSPQSQTHSPHPEEPKQLLNGECASGLWCCPDSISNQQMGAFDGSIVVQLGQGVDDGDMNGRLEDFSGIALLAAAACNNSIGDDVDNAKEGPIVEEFLTPEGFDSSISAKPLKENTASVKKDLVLEENMDGSFVQDNSMAISQTLRNNENVEEAKSPVCSKDDRLHWDLNTVMDAWEQPCDDLNVHSQSNVSESVPDVVMHIEELENLDGCEIHRNPEDIQDDTESKPKPQPQPQLQPMVCKMVSADVHGNHMPLDPSCMAPGTRKSNIEEHKLEACSGYERTWFEVNSSSTEHAMEPLKYAGADTKASTQVVSADALFGIPLCPVINHVSSTCSSEETINTTSVRDGVMQNGEDCCLTSAMQLGRTTSLESAQLGNHVVPDTAVLEKAPCEIDSIQSKDGEDSGKTSGLPDNRTSPREVISTVTCQTLDFEYSVSKSESYPSPECENLSAAIVAGQRIVTVDVKGEDDKASAADAALIGSQLHVEPKELIPKSCGHSAPNEGTQGKFISHESCETYGKGPASHSGKIDLEDPSEKCDNLDVSYDARGHIAGMENMAEFQSGYDSPFEDGELRESVLYSWDENEVEGETECVDYESDNREADDFDAVDYSMSEKAEVEQCGRGDALKKPSHSATSKTKFSGWDFLPEGRESSTDRTGEVNDVSTRKIRTSKCIHGHDIKGLSAGEVGSRASRGKLSCGEGPSCSDVLHRKGAIFIERSRSNNLDDSYFRAEREFDSEKSLGRDRFALEMRDRSQEDGHWVDSSVGYWDSRSRYATGYHARGRPRPRSDIANMAAKVEGLTCCDKRPSINYSLKGVSRPPIRRRSPIDKDDVYGMHRGRVPVRDISRVRSRGRSGIYSHGVSRGPREEFHGLAFEDPSSSSAHVPHYLARREQGFSPSLNRGAHSSQPYRKSRSRSRSRSPLTWRLQRERNVGTRFHRRSSDFRSETRMKRMRLPFQKSSFPADDEESFLSLPRGRFSPEYNSRWIDDRNCVPDHFRDRRSPVRMFRRSQRFDSVGSPGRLKSNDYFRPVIRPGRFSGMADSAGRRHKYDSSDDDRRKQGDRYEMVHRVRRYDTGGVVRRFRHDAENCFEAHNEDDCVRQTDRRDVLGAREERGPFRYNNDRMYITAPKSSGIRDYDEDASPRRG
uniref:Dentin sialophosphoprotein n=1 Tax=Davidia involucrata TaxID=16924 RepID=A0A5B6YGE3_DAVIN